MFPPKTRVVKPRGISESKPGGVIYSITEYLRFNGFATAATLSRELDICVKTVTSACLRMCKGSKSKPQRMYVLAYDLEEPGQQVYPRPVFALGSAKHAERPAKLSRAERKREARIAQAARSVTSVFALGGLSSQAMRGLVEGRNASDVSGDRKSHSGRSSGGRAAGGDKRRKP